MSKPNNTTLQHLLEIWKQDETISPNIASWHIISANQANTIPIPESLSGDLQQRLIQMGITSLYSHQSQAYDAVLAGKNIVISTGTASGKSLCYQLPILDSIQKGEPTTALLLFPTKALASDQYNQLLRLSDRAKSNFAGVYDGDTPTNNRPTIRKESRLILTNPDMLHNAILPHHTNWEPFLRRLRFVVIDEIHIYRGVFGSHVANLFRRLKRICAFYGANPTFILTTATISNPLEHAKNLLEEEFELISTNGAPNGDRHFFLYNPPVVNEELGIRHSALSEGVRLTGDLLDYQIQTLMFAHTRRAVELGVRYLHENHPSKSINIHGYRSGYLAKDRRQIEQALKTGASQAVVATNALELGVDIGSVDAVVIVGYPGTIASTRQQSGRAGRKLSPSISVLVATANPLDQYIIRHPEYVIDQSTEQALINPNNPLLLLQHLRCAIFELPFHPGDSFGSLTWTTIEAYLDVLHLSGEIHISGNRYFWMNTQFPSHSVSLRTSSPSRILLQIDEAGKLKTLGEVDETSASWMVHTHAIYLHQAQSYFVENLDLDQKIALLKPFESDYYTEALSEVEITKISDHFSDPVASAEKYLGEILVTTQVVGFRKIRWYSNEHLGTEELQMSPTRMNTIAYWLTIDDLSVKTLSELNLWHTISINYGKNWEKQRLTTRIRDRYTCQHCSRPETDKEHHVHHKIPFRHFPSFEQANRLENLITLCASCHRLAEGTVRMRSGLSGLKYSLSHLAPIFIMCDLNDLGSHSDYKSPLSNGKPTVVLYDKVPAGIGLSENIYKVHDQLVEAAMELVENCPCQDGCPSCVGVAGEMGLGGKQETKALLSLLNGKPVRV
jgi:DEAD/DEAH box helicase domain-containing protein